MTELESTSSDSVVITLTAGTLTISPAGTSLESSFLNVDDLDAAISVITQTDTITITETVYAADPVSGAQLTLSEPGPQGAASDTLDSVCDRGATTDKEIQTGGYQLTNWRIVEVGDEIEFQHYEGGTWVKKGGVSA